MNTNITWASVSNSEEEHGRIVDIDSWRTVDLDVHGSAIAELCMYV